MPTLRRKASLSRFGVLISCPSTRIEPFWMSTSAFTQRSKVDLPDPDGPMMQTTSPFMTAMSMPDNVCVMNGPPRISR